MKELIYSSFDYDFYYIPIGDGYIQVSVRIANTLSKTTLITFSLDEFEQALNKCKKRRAQIKKSQLSS